MQRFSTLSRSMLMIGAAVIAMPARAQQQPDTASPEAATNGDQIVVTATRTTRSSVELGAAEIQKALPGANPVKAIQTLPGVQFETADPWGNNEQNISLFVHGFNQNQLGFTMDGVPLGDQSYGNYNGLTPQRAVISENVARVRLTAGAADLGTASASNLGGGIETYSSDPAATMGVRFAQTLGSYDASRTFLRIDSGEVEGLGGTNSGYISVVRQKARAWEFDARQGGWQGNAKFVHKGENGTLTGYFDISDKAEPNQDSVAHNAGGIEPYYRSLLDPNWQAALAYVDANGAPPSNNPNNYMNYFGDAQRTDYLGYIKYEHRFGDAVTWTNQVYYHHDEGQGQITGPIAAAGLPGLFRIYYPGQDLKQVFGGSGYALRTTEYGIDRKGGISTLAIHAGDHEIELGGWYEHNRNTIFRRWYAAPIDNPPSPYEWADPAKRRLTQYAAITKYDLIQTHVQDRWHVTPTVTVEAGFKSSLQFADGRVPTQPLPGALPGTSTGYPEGRLNTKKWFLPAIGAIWDVSANDQLFGHIQKNVRQFQASVAAGLSPFAVGSQQAFEQIKANTSPETSWTYEAGLRSRHALDLGPLTAIEGQVSAYHVDFDNRLLQISATPVIASVIGGVSILQNVGRVQTNGVDAAATLRFGPHLSIYNALSYNSSKYRDNYVSGTSTVLTAGKYVPNTAKWLNKTVVSINDGPFEIQAIGDYVGPRFATYTNDQSIGGRYLVNLQASYTLPQINGFGVKDLKLSVNVTNVTNRKGIYELVVGAASRTWNSYAQPPRMGFITLSGAF
ncbi:MULTISPECIES: TonB-dependent receptor plug domain-containing protein [unclassified Sphingomonas]|uniref:TonB-dependent receptor n=1 Tax=unclassified Sphingomonas TaxID=196159 RepID=UPI00285D50E7|nr:MULTISPECIES: TonB-dependent receptor plug domain-containing protein [unclassified Sphingomonas]MDR6115206.1 iron complex outermembrane receptor protein [Sphingomonas sp. SORGH_AS_0789]MDR6151119.1 iron complex outermembrane receptor protein [Sphingomonas sp. SORGH_AS_0742]